MNTVLTTLPAAHRGLLDFFPMYQERQDNFYKAWIGRTFNTKELYEELALESGFKPAVAMTDGGGIQFDTITTPYQKKFYPTIYHLAWERTVKANYNDPYGIIGKAKNKIAKSLYDAKEISAASIWNNATSASFTGPDGVALASASHPTATSTFSNLTTAASLSNGTLETMYTNLLSHVSYRDFAWTPSGRFNLLVTKENIVLARRLLGSMLQPGTANNDTNAMAKYFINDVTYSPHLTSTTMMALIPVNDEDNGIFQLNGMPTMIKEDFDINTPSHKTLVMAEWTFGWIKAQGIQFNAGL